MKILIDTCVVVDFLQRREPFADAARKVFVAVATKQVIGCVTAKAVTDIYYLAHRITHSDADTRQLIKQLLGLVQLVDTSSEDILRALSSGTSDYEDAVMIETARRTKMDYIVTRNIKDYGKSFVSVLTPEQFGADTFGS